MSLVPLSSEALDRFRTRFEALYEPFTDSTVSEISLTRQMMETIKLGVLCGMQFDKDIFAIIRSLMYMDGMVLRSNPEAVLMKDMRGFIDQVLELGDPS
jgi:ubiquinone biosynthesis protein